MSFFLGGHTIIKAGWAGPQAVYVDFRTSHTGDWLWQLYANRRLVGATQVPSVRRCIGQLRSDGAHAPLTLIRVDADNVLTDYGPQLPRQPWNQFTLAWMAAGYPADANHFQITGAVVAGGAVEPTNEIALVPFVGDGPYSFRLPPIGAAGLWPFALTPRDDAEPAGNAGNVLEVTINALVPPDVRFDADGNRFTLSAVDGCVTASFSY